MDAQAPLPEFEVHATWVLRKDVTYRVFADDKQQAIERVIRLEGETVDSRETTVQRPRWSSKPVNENTPPRKR